ncbi:MAG: succinate dehydrogenase, cytochrome b556 subunit [Candidatus Zixiibacteriota bacterium]|nr:MAG: succinate dehydrogenase, cytochrome b556 subunit [candidate division Zixibacteria bacterium]
MNNNKLQETIRDANLNKNIGNFSYWLHRLTGIGLAIYLLMHTFVLSSAISGEKAFNTRMGSVQNPFFAFLEIFLIAGVFIHMLNGLRITLADFFGWTRFHKSIFWIITIIFLALMVVTIMLLWPKFNPVNYGMGG